MYDQIIFYNHFGAGDIFESREFVREWMELIPARDYFYAHGKDPSILKDIPELKFMDVTEHMNPMKDVWDDLNGNLYVNTWIGRDGKYVLPGIGCVVEGLHKMHNDMLGSYGFGQLKRDALSYIPNINYSYYNTNMVDKFIKNHTQDKILVCNGPAQSMQAENFDLTGIIYMMAPKLKDVLFILTQGENNGIDNIFTSDSIIRNEGFDLNEISYLSGFCKIIIGRNSGPHVFSQVLNNWMNPTKKIISFTYTILGSTFVLNNTLPMKKYWTSQTDNYNVERFLTEIMFL